MKPFDNDLLIDQSTGEINMTQVRIRAHQMALRTYGGNVYPPTYFNSALTAVMDLANAMRANWLADHGVSDSTTRLTDVSGWTDTFRRLQ